MATGFPIIFGGRVPVPWTPTQIPTALWLDAADASTITLNNLTVSQWNDKSGNARHVSQATAANQPVWGVGRNLLLWSEDLTNPVWTIAVQANASNVASAPDGTQTADVISVTNTAITFYQILTVTPNTTYTFSFYVRLGTLPVGDFKFAVRDDTAGQFIGTDLVPSILPTNTSWTRVTYTFTTPAGCTLARVYPVRNGSPVTGSVFLWGAQLNPGTTADTYQKTTSAAQTALVGINGNSSVVFDGTNDFLRSTANIGISGTQTFSLFAVHTFPWSSTKVAAAFGTVGRYHHMASTVSGQYWTGYEGSTQLGTYTPSTPSSPFLLGIERTGNTGASWNVYQNGNSLAVTAGNNNAVGLTDGLVSVGAFTDGTLAAAINFGEFIIVNGNLTTANRQNLEGYLAWKWGLQGSLPANHPYRFISPTA